MRIESVTIKNFRSIRHQVIPMDDYTVFVGQNGAGKSTVLCALNLFFRNSELTGINADAVSEEDFHNKDTSEPIEISVVFADLDAVAKSDFKEYVRQDRLLITCIVSWENGRGVAKQHGERMVMGAFARYFEVSAVADKRFAYKEFRATFPELPEASNAAQMEAALRSFEESHPEFCEMKRSEDQFYGFTRGSNLLAKHVSWIFVPAVKDASSEQFESKNSSLGRLLARTVRSRVDFSEGITKIREDAVKAYAELVDQNQEVLKELTRSLDSRIKDWAHQDASLEVAWQEQAGIKVDDPVARIVAGESGFQGELIRFGHGLQRSFLLALLQELSEGTTDNQPTLILAVEEPELFQHPPQARYLATVLQRLGQRKGNQVLLCTHSPHFTNGSTFQSVRMVRKGKNPTQSLITYASSKSVESKCESALGKPTAANEAAASAKLHQILLTNISEMFFASSVVLVEGLEDVAILSAQLAAIGLENDLRKLGCVFIPAGGKDAIIRPLAVLQQLGVPTMVVCDSDGIKYGVPPDPDWESDRLKLHLERQGYHQRDNSAILKLLGHIDEAPFPAAHLFKPNLIMWKGDISLLLQDDCNETLFAEAKNDLLSIFGRAKDLKKNAVYTASLVSVLHEKGETSLSLRRAAESILHFAQNA